MELAQAPVDGADRETVLLVPRYEVISQISSAYEADL
jgi:hypothetical protein